MNAKEFIKKYKDKTILVSVNFEGDLMVGEDELIHILNEFTECKALNITRVSKHSELLISFMEELTTKDIELIKQYKYEEVMESVKRNL